MNGRLIGRGEAVVVGDRYGLRITEIVAAGSSEEPEHDLPSLSPVSASEAQ